MLAFLFLGCAPPPEEGPLVVGVFTYDPETCVYSDTYLTLDETWWGEWREPSTCRETNYFATGTDGVCYWFGLDCEDIPPLRSEDPAFQPTPEQVAICDIAWNQAPGDPCQE